MQEMGDTPLKTSDIQAALQQRLGRVPQSTVRSSLQDERYFERVSRGEYRLRSDS